MTAKPDEGVGFDWFIGRAHEPKSISDENYRLGFEGRHRELDNDLYSNYIASTVFNYSDPIEQNAMIDIGAGGGVLAQLLESECAKVNLEYVMVDAEDVLKRGFQLRNKPIYGQFPTNLADIQKSEYGEKIQYILANSVLHYVRNDGLIRPFVISACDLLIQGGVAYLGDVPTHEMKYAQSIANNSPANLESANNFAWKDFADLATLAADYGFSLYVMPQPRWVPMHPHRADLMLIKHKPFARW